VGARIAFSPLHLDRRVRLVVHVDRDAAAGAGCGGERGGCANGGAPPRVVSRTAPVTMAFFMSFPRGSRRRADAGDESLSSGPVSAALAGALAGACAGRAVPPRSARPAICAPI
jgi:hypothetical protein